MAAEHLHPPVILESPGTSSALKLGYGQNMDDLVIEQSDRDELLIRTPAPLSLVQPLAEGALAVVLLLVFLGAITDVTGSAHTVSALGGSVASVLVAAVGFQGMRSRSRLLLTIYALLSGALLMGGMFGFQGVLTHAGLHVVGMVVGLLLAQNFAPRTFCV